jgi:hypothetical protein
MADQSQNKIFGDIEVAPDQRDALDAERPDGEGEPEDLRVNDEDVDSGTRPSDRPERPTTAGDMANPRTGPIG